MARYPLNLPPDLKRVAEELAKKQGVSLNQFILWSVAEKVGQLSQGLDDPNFPEVTYRRGTSGIPTPILRGTGIRVQTIATAARDWGMSSSEIANQYEIDERVVRSALAFYQAHRDEIEAGILIDEQVGNARE
jgi:uncharacterized protein (DUF433 family)